jgi:hypothetical protein
MVDRRSSKPVELDNLLNQETKSNDLFEQETQCLVFGLQGTEADCHHQYRLPKERDFAKQDHVATAGSGDVGISWILFMSKQTSEVSVNIV